MESVFAVLKRGLIGVYHHHASAKHLGRYVDEFSFRLNEGNVKNHTLTRLESFVDGTAGKRLIQGAHSVTRPTPENVPRALDAIADVVLAYKPKPKTKPAKEAQTDGSKAHKDRKGALIGSHTEIERSMIATEARSLGTG